MQRYNTISCVPGVMKVEEYTPPVVEKSDVSVVDKKYFVPLSEQRNAVFRALTEKDRANYAFPDGKDDGRDVSMRRRGVDLAEMSTNLNNVREKLSEKISEHNDKVNYLKRIKARNDKYAAQRKDKEGN